MLKQLITHSTFFLNSLAIGALVVALRLYPMFLGKTVLFGDNFSLIVPGKIFSAEWLSRGVLPFWNPEIYAGIRWLADINQSVLYPTTILFMIFSPAVALNISIAVHLIWTFIGMSLLARKWMKTEVAIYVAAVLWTLSPTMMGTVNNLSTLQSLAWVPWVIFSAVSIKRSYGLLLLAISVFAQFLGGYPQHVLFALIAGVVIHAGEYFVSKDTLYKKIGNFLASWSMAGLCVVLITAILWMPFLDVLRNSTRSLQTANQAAAGSLQPVELIKLFVPQFFENAVLGVKWGPLWNAQPNIFLYFSWFGLLVSGLYFMVGKKRSIDWSLLLLLLGSVLLAFGDNLPFFSLLQSIPVLSSSRGASTILLVGAAAGALLVGRSVDWLSEQEFEFKKWMIALLVGAVLIVGAWFFVLLNFDVSWKQLDSLIGNKLSASDFHTLEKDALIFESIVVSLFVSMAALVFSLVFAQRKKFNWLLIVLAIELCFHTQSHLFFGPNSLYSRQGATDLTSIKDTLDLTNYRVLTRNYNSPYADFGAYLDALSLRAPFSDSYVKADELQNYPLLQGMKSTATPNWNMVYELPVIHGYTTLLPAGIHRSLFPNETEFGINRMPELLTTNEELKAWAVKYYLVDTWFPLYEEPIPSKKIATAGRIDVYEIEEAYSRFRNSDNQARTVSIVEDSPNYLEFSVESPEDETLIVADRFDSNWRAKVNGVSTPITEVNNQRAVQLNAGSNLVEFWFFPSQIYKGSVLTILGIVMIGIVTESKKFSSLLS